MNLPIGFTARPASMDDVAAVTELVVACELAEDGVVEVDPDDIASDLRDPGIDLERDTQLVFGDEKLVAWTLLRRPKTVWADVHPDYDGRGIGSAILAWSEERAREGGLRRIGQTTTDANTGAAELLRRNGYEAESTAWLLAIDMGDEPPEAVMPEGIAVRAYERGRDDQDAYRLINDAFNEWPDPDPSPFEVWKNFILDREVFAPELSFLAFDGGELVGAVVSFDYSTELEGWVQQVATKGSHRHRGIGRGLLQHAFRAFHTRGRRRVGLSTNSYTGALGMYERVGMHVRRSYTRYAKSL